MLLLICSKGMIGYNNNMATAASNSSAMPFDISTPNDQKFTAGSFAHTRFGSTKRKFDLCAMKRIQHKHGMDPIFLF